MRKSSNFSVNSGKIEKNDCKLYFFLVTKKKKKKKS